MVRETSNPIFRSLSKKRLGYANPNIQPIEAQRSFKDHSKRLKSDIVSPLTIDDVVTKTSITLSILSIISAISYVLVAENLALATPFTLIGGIGGGALVFISMLSCKQDSPSIVLSYAALEGLFLGGVSFITASYTSFGGVSLISRSIVATIGVFIGMLFVYKTGTIRVTPKFTRMLIAGMFGVLALMLVNVLLTFFGVGGNIGLGLRNSSSLSILFSLTCIALAAFSFLIDFDAADQMIRAGVPAKAGWGIALSLTVTLVWLYVELLRFLSYFDNR